VVACGTNVQGQHIAKELVQEQTLDNLAAFGARLAELDARLGISAKKPDNADELLANAPIWQPALKGCASCDEPTRGRCAFCDDPLCDSWLCQYTNDCDEKICMICKDEEGS